MVRTRSDADTSEARTKDGNWKPFQTGTSYGPFWRGRKRVVLHLFFWINYVDYNITKR